MKKLVTIAEAARELQMTRQGVMGILARHPEIQVAEVGTRRGARAALVMVAVEDLRPYVRKVAETEPVVQEA